MKSTQKKKSKSLSTRSKFDWSNFEQRKRDHIRLALDSRVQALKSSDLDQLGLRVDALPDLNFNEISLETRALNRAVSSPFFISSMTAGHDQGDKINELLAELSHNKQILFAVGSLRRELTDVSLRKKWRVLKAKYPKALFIGNLGVSELVQHGVDKVLSLVEDFEGLGFYIHWNSLQEVIQPEGCPNFRGALDKLETLVKKSACPILIKEVGCGLSTDNVLNLAKLGIPVVDLAGNGGTHWGRIEGLRAARGTPRERAAKTFENWGLSNVRTLLNLRNLNVNCQLWASGGIRHGLDAAKMLSVGASMVGVAQPWMMAIMGSSNKRGIKVQLKAAEDLVKLFDIFQFELRTALFCTGSRNLSELRGKFEKGRGNEIVRADF
jgi:isopentenyl-diphosphate delta-isomerase